MYCLLSLLLLVLSLQYVVADYTFTVFGVDEEGNTISKTVTSKAKTSRPAGAVAVLSVEIEPKTTKSPSKLALKILVVPNNINPRLEIRSNGSLVTKPLGSSGDESHLLEVRNKTVKVKVKSIIIYDSSVDLTHVMKKDLIYIARRPFLVVNEQTAFLVVDEENEPFDINSNKRRPRWFNKGRTRQNTKPRQHSEIAPLKIVLSCIEDGCKAVPEAQSLKIVPVRERVLCVYGKEIIQSIRYWKQADTLRDPLTRYEYEDLQFASQNEADKYQCVQIFGSRRGPDPRKRLLSDQQHIDESAAEPQGASDQRARRSSSSSGNRFSRSMSQSSFKSCADNLSETEVEAIVHVEPTPE